MVYGATMMRQVAWHHLAQAWWYRGSSDNDLVTSSITQKMIGGTALVKETIRFVKHQNWQYIQAPVVQNLHNQ